VLAGSKIFPMISGALYLIDCSKPQCTQPVKANAYVRNKILLDKDALEDFLRSVYCYNTVSDAMTDGGMCITFDEKDVRPIGRTAQGVIGIRIDEDDEVIGMESIIRGGKATLLAITENGFGKRTELDEYRVQIRGGKGVITYKITPKTGIVQLYIVIFVTGLCFNNIPHKPYAMADKKERYKSISIDFVFSIQTFPPNSLPITIIIMPPKANW
jgi:DNA gyrase/topoisomerase IV subunit A